MLGETHLFELKGKIKEEIQLIFEMILETDLSLSFESHVIDEDEIIINFFDANVAKELQKKNMIIITQEIEKFNISIKGNISQAQFILIWNEFKRSLSLSGDLDETTMGEVESVPEREEVVEEEKIMEKDDIVETEKTLEDEIIDKPVKVVEEQKVEPKEEPELVRREIIDVLLKSNMEKGFQTSKLEVINFIENYKKKVGRYLTKDEVESVGIGYIKMTNDKMGMPITEEEIEEYEKKLPPIKEIVPVKEMVPEKEIVPKRENLPTIMKEALQIPDSNLGEVPPELKEEKIEKIQHKTVAERGDVFKKAISFEKDTLQTSTESTKLQNVSLSKKQQGIIVVTKSEGRRKCPNCENNNPRMITESIDKTILVSHYPRVFGKKFKCGSCGCEFRFVY